MKWQTVSAHRLGRACPRAGNVLPAAGSCVGARSELCPPAAGRKHMRQSTTEHTRQTFLRIQERQVQSKRKKGGPNYDRPLTQEELLEEAKITEEINLRSLGEQGTRRHGEGL